MATCTIKYNQDNTIKNVSTPDGKTSELFSELNSNIFIGNKDIAWSIQKNTYAPKIAKIFDNVTDNNYVYPSSKEPKLFYKNGKSVSDNIEDIILSNTGLPSIEMGFKNPKTDTFIKVAEISDLENLNTLQGFSVDQVKKGQLSPTKVYDEMSDTYIFQGKGGTQSTQRINAQLVVDDATFMLEGKLPAISEDGKFDIVSTKDLQVVMKNGTAEVVHVDTLPEIILDKEVDNRNEILAKMIALEDLSDNNNTSTTKPKEPKKTQKQLTTSLLGFLNRLGFTTTTLEAYKRDYNSRLGEDPTIQALVDISKKVVAFAEGQENVDNLSEEVAHIAIEMYKDQNSITTLLGEVVNHPEYNEYAEQYRDKYSEKHSGIELEDMVRREVLGKILKNKMQDKFSTENATPQQLSLFQKLAKVFENFITNIRNNFRHHNKKNFDKILDDVINSVTQEELSKFSEDAITTEDRIFFSLASEEAKQFRFSLQEFYETLNSNRRAQERSKLNIESLKSLETDTMLADQLRVTNDLLGILEGETSTVLTALSNLVSDKDVLNQSDRALAQSVIKMKSSLAAIHDGMETIRPENPALDSKFKTLIDRAEKLQSAIAKLEVKIEKDEKSFVMRVIEKMVNRLNIPEEQKQEEIAKLNMVQKDTSLIARIFGIPSNAKDVFMNALVRKAHDIRSEAKERLLKVANPYISKFAEDKYRPLQKKIIKGDTAFLLHYVDRESFDKARMQNDIDTLVRLTGVSEKIAEKAIKERDVENLTKMTDDLYEEYLQSGRDWLKDNVENRFSEQYIAATEKRYEDTNLSDITKEVLKRKSARTRETTSKAYNEDGRRDLTLLSESDFDQLQSINQQHKQDKSAFDIDGTLKQGLVVKKVSELTDEERSNSFGFLDNDFLNSIADRNVIILDVNEPIPSEEAIIAADLQKLDLYTSKQIEDGDQSFFGYDKALIEEMKAVSSKGGNAYRWATKNGNIAYTEDLFDAMSDTTPFTNLVEDYIDSIEDGDKQDEARRLLSEYKSQTLARQSLLKQNRVAGSPVEIDYDKMPIETRNAIKKLDESIAALSRQIALPSEFREEGASKLSFEQDFSEQLYAIARESGKAPLDFAQEHMTQDKRDLMGKYRLELKSSLANNRPPQSSSLTKFIKRLGADGRISKAKTEAYLKENPTLTSTEALIETILLEYAKESVPSYFKKSAPKGYETLIEKMEADNDFMIKFVQDKEGLSKDFPSLPISFIQYNPGFTWREGALDESILNPKFDVNGGLVQPRLDKYADDEFFKTYGIDKTSWLANPEFDLNNISANSNIDQFELLRGTVDIHKKIIENYNDVGVVSPYLRQQMRKQDLERKISFISGSGKLANLKDSLTDIVQNKRDEMAYGTEIESSSLKDAKGNPIVASVRSIPKYYQSLLNEPLTDNVVGAAVIALKQSEIYKSRKEKVSEMEAITNHIARQQYAESGAGIARRVFKNGQSSNTALMAKEFLNHSVYGVKDNYKVMSSLKIAGKPIDVTATIRNVTGYVRSLNLKYNPVVDGTSATTGTLFTRIESKIGEHFSEDSFERGRKVWWTLMGQYVNESGKVDKKSKMSMLLERFSIEDIDSRVSDSQYNRGLRLAEKGGFAMSKLGNMPVTPRVLLASLYDYRLYDGKIITHNEFLQVKKAERAISGEKFNRKTLVEEWKQLGDNTLFNMLEFTDTNVTFNQKYIDYIKSVNPTLTSEQDIQDVAQKSFTNLVSDVSSKSATIISRVDGVMNEVDQVMLQRHFLGALTTLHKGWLFLNLGNRFKTRHVNFSTNKIEEGHYSSFPRTAMFFFKSLKEAQFNPVEAYNKVREESTFEEYKNFKRVLLETGAVGVLWLLAGAVMADDDDDDTYLTTASKLLFMRTFGEYNSTQAVGLPGLALDQMKSPVVIQTQLESLYKGGLSLVTGDMEGLSNNTRKLILPIKRFDKLYGSENLKAYYNQYLFYNSENLLGVTSKEEE